MLNYKILSLLDKQAWKEYLQKLPVEQQDVYYTPEYYELYENYGDGKAQCFIFEKDGELALYPFLINSINKLGYDLDDEYFDIQGAYGYNGVVSSSYSSDFIDDFYTAFKKYCEDNNIVAEFTRFHPLIENHKFSINYLLNILNRKTVILNINESIEKIWENSFSSKNRNTIRKALKGNYSVKVDNSEKGIKNFYRIYLDTMRGIGANSYYYFNEEMFYSMLKYPSFKFLFVEDESNKRIATMILMIHGKYAHYHLSGRNFKKADNSVNNYILYEAINIAKEMGAELFHFGGGNSLSEKDSLFRFKKGFSKSYSEFYIGKKVHNQTVYDSIVAQLKKQHPKSFENNSNKILGYRDL